MIKSFPRGRWSVYLHIHMVGIGGPKAPQIHNEAPTSVHRSRRSCDYAAAARIAVVRHCASARPMCNRGGRRAGAGVKKGSKRGSYTKGAATKKNSKPTAASAAMLAAFLASGNNNHDNNHRPQDGHDTDGGPAAAN